MNEKCCETVAQEPSIPILDERLSELNIRLSDIEDHLKSGIYGSTEKCAEDVSKPVYMPSPSLASLENKLQLMTSRVFRIETLIKKIHC